MPKVFFFDMGLRNALLKSFEDINDRLDKWQYFENIVWREFLFKYGQDDIKYRRTTKDNEVDFIIEDKLAYEVKFNKNLIREKKYENFREKYPNIPLEFITFENVLQEVIMK
jgi:hypothetical protein